MSERVSESFVEFQTIVKRVNCHADLVEALEKMVEMYIEMINSGDCGNWNPENDTEVILARSALAKAYGEQS